MDGDDPRRAMWLTFVHRVKSGHGVIGYSTLGAALDAGEVLPPGVALYATRATAKLASKWATDHCNRPPPKHAQPVGYT